MTKAHLMTVDADVRQTSMATRRKGRHREDPPQQHDAVKHRHRLRQTLARRHTNGRGPGVTLRPVNLADGMRTVGELEDIDHLGARQPCGMIWHYRGLQDRRTLDLPLVFGV